MHQNPYYMITNINHQTYLQPFGQAIARFGKSVTVNDTGLYIWNQLEDDLTRDELITRVIRYYDVLPEEQDNLIQDVDEFIHRLSIMGIIQDNISIEHESCYQWLSIGTLLIKLCGDPSYFSENFAPFMIEGPSVTDASDKIKTSSKASKADLMISVHNHSYHLAANGTILLHTNDICLIEQSEKYLLYFTSMSQKYTALLGKDGKNAHIYTSELKESASKEDLFHIIRFLYLYTAQKHGIFAIHSASIHYKHNAWLFSGHSGMGKSTHANLWHHHFYTKLINGDLNLITIKDGEPLVYGLPWCGTSEIFSTSTYSLGGIIFLKKAETDHMVELTNEEKIICISQRLISPTWTLTQTKECLYFAEKLAKHIMTGKLYCTKEISAALCSRDAIDQYLLSKK